MKYGLLTWSPCPLTLSLTTFPAFFSFPVHRPKRRPFSVSATIETTDTQEEQQQQQHLSARERRQLRNQRRESKAAYNWREEVEEKLIKKPKKRYASWTEELNLDNLALLGPQWWIVRVGRIRGQETADLIARSLARNFPDIDFTVYAPALQEKRKLKNGSISTKAKPLFPGCVFLKCVLNKELHDFIREVEGVGGFVGSKVGNTKRQINKPRPVSHDDIEAIFRKAKEEQERADQAFEEEQKALGILNNEKVDLDSASKPLKQSRKTSAKAGGSTKIAKGGLVTGSTVRILSGNFAGFEGNLKKLNRKSKKATVGFTLFGKETLVDLDVNEILCESS